MESYDFIKSPLGIEAFVMNNTTSVAVRIFMTKQLKQQGF